jgi:hypothetical protein
MAATAYVLPVFNGPQIVSIWIKYPQNSYVMATADTLLIRETYIQGVKSSLKNPLSLSWSSKYPSSINKDTRTLFPSLSSKTCMRRHFTEQLTKSVFFFLVI